MVHLIFSILCLPNPQPPAWPIFHLKKSHRGQYVSIVLSCVSVLTTNMEGMWQVLMFSWASLWQLSKSSASEKLFLCLDWT